jgi:hypothetical protein
MLSKGRGQIYFCSPSVSLYREMPVIGQDAHVCLLHLNVGSALEAIEINSSYI